MNISHTSIDFNNRLICIVKDDIIYEVNGSGEMQEIGHTEKWCDELVELAEEYRQLCIDNGIIEEPKTPEQIQLEMMQAMMQQIQNLTNKVEELENGNGNDATSQQGSTAAGRKRTASKPSSKESAASDGASPQ